MHTTLISAEQLAQHIHDPSWVILDCRHDLMNPRAGREAFDAGHLPGAQFADTDTDLSDKSPGPDGAFRGRHPLPSRDAFIATLRRWGVNDGTQVVAYDAHGAMFAARLWWMLRWVGHEAVAVLDGGLPAWQAAGQPLVTEVAARPAGGITAKASRVPMVGVDELVASLGTGGRLVVDARAPDRFRGENEIIDPVAGHIPGAVNRFFKDNLAADGRFKPASQLRNELGAIVPDVEKAVMQCGSGVTACHNLLALEVAGMTGASLYPGSWSEWCADAKRPVATGS
ncbi:sulfurtransferase [Noviherbaspirillum galbum]|uniref:Sulfurtransferase n=1 Tax=Noviherbaspirillum galbum TaxID=2709383 RepID=A0A6B3SUV8_9BURK|nr:sulfurtransferase [Noviherbaspirillum galbum]NEX64278.1 sulfurtransferase [Noviherbaspirillum galbum]